MIKRNPNIKKISNNYLFVEIAKRKSIFLSKHPTAKLLSLGIGDTTEPIPKSVAVALEDAARKMGDKKGYSGYGSSKGRDDLCQLISHKIYQDRVSPEDIFISDGSKCDIGRLQLLFSPQAKIAVQDPSYPVYVGTSVLTGKTDEFSSKRKQYDGMHYLPCKPENGFFPDLEQAKGADVFYFCSPNNPTGAVPNREQLTELVKFAKKESCLLVFDSAYAFYIQDKSLPCSIYEIEGADEVAIETGSFSKFVGFTGVRLGWTVVPENIQFDDGSPVKDDWIKILSNFFNGASNIVQEGALAILQDEGLKEANKLVEYYMTNARILKRALEKSGYVCYGGEHAPYIWVDLEGESSWEAFERFLQKFHIVTTPGIGFGASGEGFLRISAFGHREDIEEAAMRINSKLDLDGGR